MSIAAPGRVKEITSTANPIIKDIRLLEKKRHREETNSFIAEGMKLLIDAMEKGWTLRTLIHSKAAQDNPGVAELSAKCVAHGCDVLIVSQKVLQTIARRDNPQMVCGVVERRVAPLNAVQGKKDDLWVALDRVRDPGNLGTIIRTCDALGAKGVILVGDCTDPFAMETVRATMGSLFSMPIVQTSTENFLAHVKTWSGQVIGTHLKGAVDVRTPKWDDGPIMLIMGNEQSGMPNELTDACTSLVKIPQVGDADSLNLAIATGITVFEARRHALKLD